MKHQLYQVQQPDQLMLPAWVKVTEVRFNEINGKENQLRTSIGRKITLNSADELLKDIVKGRIDKNEAKKTCNSIADDANGINKLNATTNKIKMKEI